MMSQTHLIFGLAAFGQPAQPKVIAAALTGAILPDLSLYLMAGTHLLILQTPPDVVFGQLYYSESWQAIFRVDNSFIVWGLVFVLALMLRSRVVMALAGAALLHLALDFPLHNDDARAHFWPVTDWKFISPVSYWDPMHYGRLVGGLEVVASIGACVWMFRRYRSTAMRVFIGLLAGLQAMAGAAMAIAYLT